MKTRFLLLFFIIFSGLAGMANAVTTKWTADFMAVTPFAGINDVHFRWEVKGGKNVWDVSPLVSSYKFAGTTWGTIKDDGVASSTNGSLDLSNPSGPIATGTKLSFKFSIVVSHGEIPMFTRAYWTVNGIGEDQPRYQIDLQTNGIQFTPEPVPLPAGLPLLALTLGSLMLLRRRA